MDFQRLDKWVDNWMVDIIGDYFGRNSTEFYWIHDYWEESADPRTRGYFLVDISSIGIAAVLMSYVFTVFVTIPEIMRKKKPFQLRKAMIFYNIFLVITNAYFFFKVLFSISGFGREMWNFSNPKTDSSEKAMAFIDTAYWYYLSKIVDFFDTFFMAFKKKNTQITFLHIWHHISMVGAGWMFMKYNPYMPTESIIPIVNGFIHVVMYGYYALAALGPQYQKYLWWKKYITQMQLIQFTVVFAWFIIVYLRQTDLPGGYLAANLGNATFLFLLFSNFYFRAYNMKSRLKTN